MTRWWHRERHAARLPHLRARTAIKRAIRDWFDTQNYDEIDAGCLQVSPSNETHLRAFATELTGPLGTDEPTHPLFLHTSPEFACKKLLAAGHERIFTFAPAFRNGETSRLHAPEFIMLEWYQTGLTFDALLNQISDLIVAIAASTPHKTAVWQDKRTDLTSGIDRMTVCDAFAQFASIDLTTNLAAGQDRDAFATAATDAGHRIASDDTWSDIFSKIMTATIEPNLGVSRPLLLTHYPESEGALARLTNAPHEGMPGAGNTRDTVPDAPGDVRAERAELYICGVEIANGYAELVDADLLEQRLTEQMDEMQRRYGQRYPIDGDFVDAVRQMPPAIGCALGFDRLVMLLTGANQINDVIWTPLDLRSRNPD